MAVEGSFIRTITYVAYTWKCPHCGRENVRKRTPTANPVLVDMCVGCNRREEIELEFTLAEYVEHRNIASCCKMRGGGE